MTDSVPSVAADAVAIPQRRRGSRAPRRAAETGPGAAPSPRNPPLLDRLAGFYPHLFGEKFLPLKRGIFQDLLAAHPDAFDRDALKAALAFHTRSTRYLSAVASGEKRHDLQAQAVEDMAPEHVHHALLEVFRRRQARSAEDLKPKLRERIVQAIEASGLSRVDYAERVRTQDEAATALLDEALAEVAVRAARDEALLRAFTASGQTVEAFASAYGLEPQAAARTLERARKRAAEAPR
jgi:ProP effector